MTTIKLSDLKGNELLEDFADYVKTGAMEARAIVSVQTGSLKKSTKITKTKNGFMVYADPAALKELSKSVDYYAYDYSVKGYVRYPAFPYIEKAFESIGDKDSVGRAGRWTAKYKSGRNGSGYANDDGIGNDVLSAFTKQPGFKVNIPRRLRKS